MKRALVLSGGGQLGAFQAGVLSYLMGKLNRKYKIYLGISVGAINAGYLSMFTSDQNVVASKCLKSLWLNINTKDIYKRWFPFGKVHALWKKSLYNSEPLKKLIYSRIDSNKILKSGNNLKIGAVSLETGNYKMFDETYPNLLDAILASSAFPGILSPIKLESQFWTDGGVRDITPMKDAIDMNADVIDVILTSTKSLKKDNPDNTLDVAVRSISIMTNEILINDINTALLVNELVNAGAKTDKKYIEINIYRPEKILSESLLKFKPEEIVKMINHGYKVASHKHK